MSDAGATAAQILNSIAETIAADSSVMAAGLADDPEAADATGFSDLFHGAAGIDDAAAYDYRFALEYIYEGYLLHYGISRIFTPGQPSFALLAGDYMYARGLNLVTARGDLESVRLLSALIDFCALVHCEGLDAGLAADAWALTTLRMAAAVSGRRGPGDAGAVLPRRSGDPTAMKRELTAAAELLLDGYTDREADGLRDELCNIYSSFDRQRRRDGTG